MFSGACGLVSGYRSALCRVGFLVWGATGAYEVESQPNRGGLRLAIGTSLLLGVSTTALAQTSDEFMAAFGWEDEPTGRLVTGGPSNQANQIDDRGAAFVPLPTAMLLGAVGLGTVATLRRRRPMR